jgi:hypothetical protein
VNKQALANIFFLVFQKAAKVEKSREAFFEYEAKQAADEESRVRLLRYSICLLSFF